jgi:hypothetical protein
MCLARGFTQHGRQKKNTSSIKRRPCICSGSKDGQSTATRCHTHRRQREEALPIAGHVKLVRTTSRNLRTMKHLSGRSEDDEGKGEKEIRAEGEGGGSAGGGPAQADRGDGQFRSWPAGPSIKEQSWPEEPSKRKPRRRFVRARAKRSTDQKQHVHL